MALVRNVSHLGKNDKNKTLKLIKKYFVFKEENNEGWKYFDLQRKVKVKIT